jgi:DNA repair exonuclease SbcCD ATPase subunit
MQEKLSLSDQLSRRSAEADSAARQLALVSEDATRSKARLSEASERMALVDTLQSKVHRLTAELAQERDERAHREQHLREQAEELRAQEERLNRLRADLDAREHARREQRRRERRQVDEHFGVLDPPGGLHHFGAQDLDCAWASGPVDRRLLQAPLQSQQIQQQTR